ncbi:MAG TPA: zf-HC2 domain-containing protein [Gemmatimonadaceae bacterium]|nr:zf-HC2 domain-containing protein [Gemmatimonadaceae bacterium]
MSNWHPADGDLRAYADAEISQRAAFRIRRHLRTCPECTAALAAERQSAAATRAVLSMLEPRDVGAAWDRISERRSAQARLSITSWWVSALAVVVVVAAMFAARPRLTEHIAGGRRDVCCWNLDGGRGGDDGILTVSQPGEQVDCVIVYDDVDRSHSLTPGDVIRYVSDPVACGLKPGAIHATAGELLQEIASR